MKRIEAACPSCGGPVEFKTSSALVAVCPSCHSAVARTDRALQDLGTVAAIVQTDTPFYLGQTGRFRDHPFELVGHVQYRHTAGGVWNEWYAAFPGERWCWIAEAQGKLYITQEKPVPDEAKFGKWDDMAVGESIDFGSHGIFTVSERGEASAAGAEGEIPFALRPGASHRFVDLAGPDGQFATMVFDTDTVSLYRGRETSLADLGISAPVAGESEPVEVSAVALTCPHCGGSLDLNAPDAAQRVTCPYCSSLLDVEQGHLKYLTTLDLRILPHIPLGREGDLFGQRYEVIGFLRRAVRFDREYTWDEYLLYAAPVGFRWLVHSDRHWSFVEPITANLRRGSTLEYDGKTYALFQRAWARVVYVLGEFYWKVAVGETVLAEDYISPPRMITLEMTPALAHQAGIRASEGWMQCKYSEMNASLGTYLPHDVVEAAFKVRRLPLPATVAPNQPAPDNQRVFWIWPAFVAACLALDVVFSAVASHPVDHAFTVVAVIAVSAFPIGVFLYNQSFEKNRWADSEFSPYETGDD